MYKVNIPEIPHEAAVKAKLKTRKVWMREDLDLKDPAIFIDWKASVDLASPNPKQMVEDPEYDFSMQIKGVERTLERLTAGEGFCNVPCLNLIHFGTAPIATAFGSEMILRDGLPPAFEPVVHTPEEVIKLKKPNLWKDGMLGKILERIGYYNEMTQGKLPVAISDNAGPWSIATSIWHYEDMLEAIHTAPDAVHHLLRLVTECIIEVNCIQMEVMRNSWGIAGDTTGGLYLPHGCWIGDDVMVTVSPKQWEEFFKPYNEILSKEYGGVSYHCCMKHDWHLEGMSKTQGFVGFDADPAWNNVDIIEKVLCGRGVWMRRIEDWSLIKRFKGKVAFFIAINGKTKQDAIDKVEKLKEFLNE